MDKILLPDNVKASLLAGSYVDDFFEFVASDIWLEVTTDDNAAAAVDADGVNGILQLTVTTDDNEEEYIHTREIFKFADRKNFMVFGRFQYAEANTDDANVIFGVADAWAANHLQDNGAGPLASYHGGLLFKVDGGTRWNFETSNAGTQTTTELDITAGGSSFVTAALEFNPISSTVVEVIPWIDTAGGNNLQQVRRYGANPREPNVKHTMSYSSATEMAFGFGIKNGGGNSETLNMDLAGWAFRR